MNNILLRAITGSVFVALLVSSIVINPFLTFGVFSVFLLLGLVEFFKLFKDSKVVQINWYTPTLIFFLTFILLFLSVPLDWNIHLVIACLVPSFLVLILTELWRKKENPMVNIGVQLFGFFYLVIPFLLLIILRFQEVYAVTLLIGMFVLIWSNDTFAYLSGRFFGKTKLFERISPKKTWEGSIGGAIMTILVGIIIGLNDVHRGLPFWVIASIIIIPCAIYGDLLESLFKRSLNIKDSGTILPGHGGILDRFDAALFTIPFFYCWWVIYPYLFN